LGHSFRPHRSVPDRRAFFCRRPATRKDLLRPHEPAGDHRLGPLRAGRKEPATPHAVRRVAFRAFGWDGDDNIWPHGSLVVWSVQLARVRPTRAPVVRFDHRGARRVRTRENGAKGSLDLRKPNPRLQRVRSGLHWELSGADTRFQGGHLFPRGRRPELSNFARPPPDNQCRRECGFMGTIPCYGGDSQPPLLLCSPLPDQRKS